MILGVSQVGLATLYVLFARFQSVLAIGSRWRIVDVSFTHTIDERITLSLQRRVYFFVLFVMFLFLSLPWTAVALAWPDTVKGPDFLRRVRFFSPSSLIIFPSGTPWPLVVPRQALPRCLRSGLHDHFNRYHPDGE